jgi:phosphatidylglycerophosphate synthase
MNAEALDHTRKWALSADALTAGRAALTVPLGVAAASGRWTFCMWLLSVAWWSDFLDGRLARRAGGGTRFGDWDMTADTIVGSGLMVGLTVGGHLSPWLSLAAGVLAVGYAVRRNPAVGMLIQAIAYGAALVLSARTEPAGFWPAVLTIGMIAVLDVRRLFGYVLPTFFAGLVGRRRPS